MLFNELIEQSQNLHTESMKTTGSAIDDLVEIDERRVHPVPLPLTIRRTRRLGYRCTDGQPAGGTDHGADAGCRRGGWHG